MAVAQGLYSHEKSSDGLTKRQRQVRDMLNDGKTQLDVASTLGISRQRVRQIVEDLMRRKVELPQGIKPPPATDYRGRPTGVE